MKQILILVLIVCIACAFDSRKEMKAFHLTGDAQGTTYHLTYYAFDSMVAKRQIDSIVSVIDSSLSVYKPYSLINQFNSSVEGITIDTHFKNVVNKSLDTYWQTGGLFDITILPLMEAWGFGTKRPTPSSPDSSAIAAIKKCIGSDKLRLQNSFLSKQKPCIRIDVNGIAQGYTVDVVASFLENVGVVTYLVEIGGEIRVNGKKPDGSNLTVAIESPPDNEFVEAGIQKRLYLKSGAVTTSGGYRKYYESGGKRITHLMNPLTGYTVMNNLISVTVYAADAITADAFDNAIMAMGLEKGLRFVNNRKNMAAYFIYRDNDGNIKDTASTAFYPLVN